MLNIDRARCMTLIKRMQQAQTILISQQLCRHTCTSRGCGTARCRHGKTPSEGGIEGMHEMEERERVEEEERVAPHAVDRKFICL